MEKATNTITVTLIEGDVFSLVDPDTGKAFCIESGILHDKRYFVDSAIHDYFLSLFPGKTECACSDEAAARIQSIADWNEDYEEN